MQVSAKYFSLLNMYEMFRIIIFLLPTSLKKFKNFTNYVKQFVRIYFMSSQAGMFLAVRLEVDLL